MLSSIQPANEQQHNTTCKDPLHFIQLGHLVIQPCVHTCLHASQASTVHSMPLPIQVASHVQQRICTADHAAVAQAMQQCIQQPSFGQETDAICAWFYEWYRSDAPLLRRFVARFAPDLARRYLFHCLSTSERDPVPGLEVLQHTTRMSTIAHMYIVSDVVLSPLSFLCCVHCAVVVTKQ